MALCSYILHTVESHLKNDLCSKVSANGDNWVWSKFLLKAHKSLIGCNILPTLPVLFCFLPPAIGQITVSLTDWGDMRYDIMCTQILRTHLYSEIPHQMPRKLVLIESMEMYLFPFTLAMGACIHWVDALWWNCLCFLSCSLSLFPFL